MPDDVKALLGRALDGEPPLRLDREEIFADGKRRLRRRRSIAIGGVATAVVVAALGTTALAGGVLGRPADHVGPAASASTPPLPQNPPTTRSSEIGKQALGISWRELTDAVRPGSPLWPSEVTGVRGIGQGPTEFHFRGQTLVVHLSSASGARKLTVTVEPPNTLRMFCKQGEDCSRQENVDGTVIRTKIEHNADWETVLVNVRRSNGSEVSVVEAPAIDHERRGRLLPFEVLAVIGTFPGLGP